MANEQANEQADETTGVIICGGGPTGALLSALLGQLNVPNIVLEREVGITTDPRGIALDDDGIRCLQAIGMYDRVFTRIGHSQCLRFVSGSSNDLHKRPFLTADPTTSESNTCHPGIVFHKQPELEQALRDAASESGSSAFKSGCTLVSISEDDASVTAEYTDPQGQTRRISAPFLVGSDGKTGFVRKMYLEPKGVQLLRCEGTNYDETWVALNLRLRLPTPETHPEYPLWSLGYTPEQVFEAFFPTDFRFLCNPLRPSVCGRFGRPEDRLWRFEFVVKDGEDAQKMASPEETMKIIQPYLTHPGSWYALADADVSFPDDCIETLRSRPFSFLARSCNKWALGRVILVGDAAHVFPPFGGQGIASGFRDAMGLAWRLYYLHRTPSAEHKALLEGWYVERKQQLEKSLAATIRNGEFVTNGDPLKALARDWGLWALQMVPGFKRRMEKAMVPVVRYQYEPGLPFIPEMGGGKSFPQVCAIELGSISEGVVFTDDLVFSKGKVGLMQLLLLARTIEEAQTVLSDIEGVSAMTRGLVLEREATVLIHDHEAVYTWASESHCQRTARIARVASAEDFGSSDLCKNRPEPRNYDPWRLWKTVGMDTKFTIIRPDRFIFACAEGKEQLHQVLTLLPQVLKGV